MWAKTPDSVHKPQFLKRKESRSGSHSGPSVCQHSALPLGHTGSRSSVKTSPALNAHLLAGSSECETPVCLLEVRRVKPPSACRKFGMLNLHLLVGSSESSTPSACRKFGVFNPVCLSEVRSVKPLSAYRKFGVLNPRLRGF